MEAAEIYVAGLGIEQIARVPMGRHMVEVRHDRQKTTICSIRCRGMSLTSTIPFNMIENQGAEASNFMIDSQEQFFERYTQDYVAGTLLFREGDDGHEMYVVRSGLVRISVKVRDVDKTLAVLGPGEFFGEMAILNQRPRTATASVVEDARLLMIESKTFESMVSTNSEIAIRLIRKLSDRLEKTDRVIEILMYREPRARVILGLSSLARDRGQETPEGIIVNVSIEELADHVGLEVSVAMDALKRLERSKMISPAGPSGMLVRDINRMQEFLAYLEMKEKFDDF